MRPNRPSSFTRQHDQYDCGVVCLRNVLNYYKADISIEKLREWSGANTHVTSLLGLHQAATVAGFKAEGARATGVDDLAGIQSPCILHVTLDGGRTHYVVYYPQPQTQPAGKLLIGDPAQGIVNMEPHQLEAIWHTHNILLLTPGGKLSQWQRQRQKKIRWLLQTLKPDTKLLVIAGILGIVCAMLNLSTTVFSQRLLDNILPAHDKSRLFIGLCLLGGLLLMKSIFTLVRQQLLVRQGYAFNLRLTGGFFRSLLFLNKSFFDNRQTGDLIARLDDTKRIQQAAGYVLGEMSVQCLVLLATIGLLFVYSAPIALLCLLTIPVVFAIVKFFEKDIVKEERAAMVSQARNESNYVDSIRGIHTIKVMNRESLFADIAAQFFLSVQTSVMQLGKIRIRFNLLLEIVAAIFLLTIIGWAALDTWSGSLRTGQLIAIIQLAGILMQTVILIALTSLQVQEAAVAMDRMYEFTTVDPEYSAPATAEAIPISFRQLLISQMSFRFPGRRLLLKEVSMQVKRGEIIALSGESGQGKSTLLQVLQKFYPFENGAIRINDQDLDMIDTPSWRRTIGVVPQDIAVFSGTLMANICLDPGLENIESVRRFCHAYGFHRYFESLPQSYTTLLGEGGLTLSGGQKQLLALARCLYARPQLVLLDEPTAAMDSLTEQFVITVLQRYRHEAGLLIVSHKDSLTSIADKVYLLDKGSTYPIPHVTSFATTN